jgi:hypothetical protein
MTWQEQDVNPIEEYVDSGAETEEISDVDSEGEDQEVQDKMEPEKEDDKENLPWRALILTLLLVAYIAF